MRHLLITLIGTAAILSATSNKLSADPANPDPLVGHWFWHHNISVEFKADGTATSDVNSQGTWTFLRNVEVERKYRVNWDQGKFIDTVVLAPDGKTARLISKLGKYNIRRKTD